MATPLSTPRVKVPETAKAGDTIIIRTLIGHPMESGFRRAPDGSRVPRDIIGRFECHFEGALVMACGLSPGVAANPYIEFEMTIETSGRFRFVWIDEHGQRAEADADIVVT